MINGVTQLIMMKSDVMNDFETISVATAYEIGGRTTSDFPYEITATSETGLHRVRGLEMRPAPVRQLRRVPRSVQALRGVHRAQTGVPVKIISVGPDRGETIVR